MKINLALAELPEFTADPGFSADDCFAAPGSPDAASAGRAAAKALKSSGKR